MTAQPHDNRTSQPLSLYLFTPAGDAALTAMADHLAAAIDTSTPESIADGLLALYRLDNGALAHLIDEADVLNQDEPAVVTGPYAPLRPSSDLIIWFDGFRKQLPGWWPHRPNERHLHYRQGYWTRDGEQLVLSCCGIDGT